MLCEHFSISVFIEGDRAFLLYVLDSVGLLIPESWTRTISLYYLKIKNNNNNLNSSMHVCQRLFCLFVCWFLVSLLPLWSAVYGLPKALWYILEVLLSPFMAKLYNWACYKFIINHNKPWQRFSELEPLSKVK